jgi:nucleoside-diphosphate-sugar epimerase
LRALVSGATGLLGSHIVERLVAEGINVRALVRPTSDTSFLRTLGVELVTGDVTDVTSLRPAMPGVDLVFHTAAIVGDWGTWEDFRRVGLEGTRNILAAAATAKVKRFLHISSIAVYGLRAFRGQPLNESTPYDEQPEGWNHYVREKIESEKLVLGYCRNGHLASTVIRPSVVWGARDRVAFPRIIAIMRSFLASVVGTGRNRVPSVAATDVAELCVQAAQHSEAVGQAFNCSGAEPISQIELYRILSQVAGVPLPKRHVPYPMAYSMGAALEWGFHLLRRQNPPLLTRLSTAIMGTDYVVDTRKTHTTLGWKAQSDYREAIAAAAAWQRTRLPAVGVSSG